MKLNMSALIADYLKYHICLVKNLNNDGTVQQTSFPYNKIQLKLPLSIVGNKNTCTISQSAIHNIHFNKEQLIIVKQAGHT